MTSSTLLKKDACASLVNSYDTEFRGLIMQVLEIYPGTLDGHNVGSRDEYGIILSDGKHAMLVMFHPSLNAYIKKNDIRRGSFFRIDAVKRKVLGGYRIITILKGAPVGRPADIIGNPVEVSLRVEALVSDERRDVDAGREKATFRARSGVPAPARPSHTDPVVGPVQLSPTHDSAASNKHDLQLTEKASSQNPSDSPVPAPAASAQTVASATTEDKAKDKKDKSKKKVESKAKGESQTKRDGKTPKRAYAGLPKVNGSAGPSRPVYTSRTRSESHGTSVTTKAIAAGNNNADSAYSKVILSSEVQSDEPNLVMLSDLDPKKPMNWFTYVRVCEIHGPHAYANEKGSGRVLSLKVKDCAENYMRAVLFDDAGIEGMLAQAKVGSIIRISNVKVAPVAPRYKSPDILPFQLNITGGSDLDFVLEAHGISPVAIPLTNIQLLRGMEAKSKVNVLGIILNVGKLASMSAEQRVASDVDVNNDPDSPENGPGERKRLELQVVDQTMHVVRVALWKDKAVTFGGKVGQAVLFKKIVVASHGGVSLNAYDFTEIILKPDVEGAKEIVEWYENLPEHREFKHISSGYSGSGGLTGDVEPRSSTLSIDEVVHSELGHGTRVDTFHIEGYFTGINPDTIYEACRHPDCNKDLKKNNGVCPIPGHENPPEGDDGEKRWCYKLTLFMGSKKEEMVTFLAFSPAADEILGEAPEELIKTKVYCYSAYEQVLKDLIQKRPVWKLTVQARTRRWQNKNGWWCSDLQYVIVAAHRKEEDEDVGKDDVNGDEEDDSGEGEEKESDVVADEAVDE